jgi:hypothetical protein
LANAIVLETFADLRTANIPPPGFLWGNIFARQTYTLVHAATKRAKSWVTLNFSVALACGLPTFLDIPVYGPGRSIIWQAEINRYNVQERLLMMIANMPGEAEVTAEMLARVKHNFSQAKRLSDIKTFTDFRKLVADERPDAVWLDPLAHTVTADENDNAAMGVGLERVMSLRQLGCMVGVVHHNRKESDTTRGVDPMQNSRGADRITADADMVVSMSRGRKHPLGPLSKFHFTSRNSKGVEPFSAVFNTSTGWWERAYERGDSELIGGWCAAAAGGTLTFVELEGKMREAWGIWDEKHHRAAFRALDKACEVGVLQRVGTGTKATYAKAAGAAKGES